MIGWVRAWRSGAVGLAELRTGGDEMVHDDPQVGSVLGVGDGGSVAVEVDAAQAEASGADEHGAGADAHDRRRAGALLALTDPEQEVDVGLVGRLVGGEARIAVDPEQRSSDPRVSSQPGCTRAGKVTERASTSSLEGSAISRW
jgi:hypothetical protein